MIVVRIDRCRPESRRRDLDPIGACSDARADLGKLRRHRRDAIGLLDAPTADIHKAHRCRGEQRRHRERHCRVGNGRAVEYAAAKRSACARFDEIISETDIGALLRQHIGKTNVALNRIARNAGDANRSAADDAGRQEIRRGRCVAFDIDYARASIMSAGWNVKRFLIGRVDGDAETPHKIRRHRNVRLRDQRRRQRNARSTRLRAARERQREQQRGKKLARHIAANADIGAGFAAGSADGERRIAGFPQVTKIAAEHAQRVDQIADRTLVHPFDARQLVITADNRQRCGQRTKRRPRIAQKQFCTPLRKISAHAIDDAAHRRAIACDAYAKRRQRIRHSIDVVGIEQVSQRGGSFCQRRQQQRAV